MPQFFLKFSPKKLTHIIDIKHIHLANSIPIEERLAAMDEAKNSVKSRKQISKCLKTDQ